MKKVLLFVAIAAIACSCGKTTGYTINGQIEGLDAPMVYLSDEFGAVIDSASVNAGKFRFKGTAEEPVVAYIGSMSNEPLAMFILENGKIKLEGNIAEPSSLNFTGTVSNDKSAELAILRGDIEERYYAAETDEAKEAIIEEDNAIITDAINNNPDNFFGLLMLNDMTHSWSSAQVLEALDKFTPEMQNTKLGTKLREQAEAKKRTEVGQPCIDIVLPCKDGNEVALSSYIGEGKYVLIDFWASWCVPCMMEVPYLKETYDVYHEKGFEIFGVSLDRGDNAESAWLNAIETNKMNWVHTALFKSPDNTAPKDYSIVTIPANFLVSPEGVIIAKDLRGEALKAEIAKYIE